ncbi:MAG: ferrochelatase [Anaerolineales bacterium]|nr:ferrochelatase [Anaerolineales bacterium]
MTDHLQTSTPASTAKLGVLVANTGTPDQPTPPALRRYLAEFLSDRRVIEFPRWLWLPLLHGIILNVRPRRSARLYRRVWTEQGSPLLVYTQQLAARLESELQQALARPVQVVAGMRYGNPALRQALHSLQQAGASQILVLPLFPQYSGTTTGTILAAVMQELQRWRWVPPVRWVSDYHDHPAYIQALADNLRPQLAQGGKLLFSFHGIPQSYVRAGDPYEHQCRRTAELLAQELGLAEAGWSLAFQSRFGPQAWLEPYTDEVLAGYGAQGLAHLQVACPGFAVDCLETTDEIGHEGRREFQGAGGGAFDYLPALNASPEHVRALAQIVLEQI